MTDLIIKAIKKRNAIYILILCSFLFLGCENQNTIRGDYSENDAENSIFTEDIVKSNNNENHKNNYKNNENIVNTSENHNLNESINQADNTDTSTFEICEDWEITIIIDLYGLAENNNYRIGLFNTQSNSIDEVQQ